MQPSSVQSSCTSSVCGGVGVDKEAPKKPPVIRQNNRLFQREQIVRNQKNNHNKGDLFQYAINKTNGSVLAEQKWQEHRQAGKGPVFHPRPPPPRGAGSVGATRMLWTLQKLQQELHNSKQRHEQKRRLPEEKPFPTNDKKPVKLYEPSIVQPSSVQPSSSTYNTASSSSQPRPSYPGSSTTTTSHISSNSNPYASTNANPYASTTTTTTGSHNPTSSFASASATLAPPNAAVRSNTNTNHHNNSVDDYFDDGLDDILADMDDDALLSQVHSAAKQSTSSSSSTTMGPPPPRFATNTSSGGGFDYGTTQFSSINNNNGSGVPCCTEHNLPCQILTSNSSKNPGRQFYKCSMPQQHEQCNFFEWVDDSGGGGGGGSGGGGIGGNSYSNNTTTYSNNNNNNNNNNHNYQAAAEYSNNNNNSYQDSSYVQDTSFGGSSYNFGDSSANDDSGGAPLCPGHGRPCLTLTSNSSKNPGRQFYKCSMPGREEQCDYFEWADGGDNNNNSNHNNSSMSTDFVSTAWNQTTLPGAPPPCPLAGVKDIHEENRRVFGHKKFRPGQQQIIENAVGGKDVFVLMPTGGGKSLCYQLPAWCCPGLAVVISPLLSLIQDQVQSLTKVGVEAVFLNSSQDYQTEQRDITRRLNATTNHSGVKLLYLTPEKLRHSNMIQEILRRLTSKGLVSRFIIDEAHCLSDWGHDFRPDYANLSFLRETFPSVPLMALTATANEKVVNDAIRSLRMKTDCYRYKSSFNRPNLHYEVRKKDSKVDDSICDYIVQQKSKTSHPSGVIYCLSRKDCEKLSKKLQEKLNERGMSSIKVSFYHAELDPHEKERRHLDWTKGRVSVLCATIAFGMGIDKPDVRFVIHYSMPKSITHYYQESGRAGRDGERADCVLFYSYKDKQILEGMIKKSSNNTFSQSTRRKIDQLYGCLRYCEDDFRCRRTMQLEFFGETFEKSKCKNTCDNCQAGREIDKRDLTEAAKAFLNLLSSIQSQRRNGPGVTLLQLTELFRGSKAKGATKFLNLSNLRGYGDASKYQLKKKQDIDRVSHALILQKIMVETSEQNKQGFSSDYVQPGEKAQGILTGGNRFFVDFPKACADKENSVPAAKESKKKKTPPKAKTAAGKSAKKRSFGVSNQNNGDDGAPNLHDVVELFDNDDDDDDSLVSKTSIGAADSLLSSGMTMKLQNKVKKAAQLWANEEELLCGNKNLYYWHILSNEVMKKISYQCPTTIEELGTIDGLGAKKMEDYGAKIVRIVQNFIDEENLEQQVLEKKGSKPPAKKQKIDNSSRAEATSSKGSKSAGATVIQLDNNGDEFDEFATDIDFSKVDELPDGPPAQKSGKTSKYF